MQSHALFLQQHIVQEPFVFIVSDAPITKFSTLNRSFTSSETLSLRNRPDIDIAFGCNFSIGEVSTTVIVRLALNRNDDYLLFIQLHIIHT